MAFPHPAFHGRNVQELFVSSNSRVVRIHNLGLGAALLITSLLDSHGIMLPVSTWSLREQYGGPPPGCESSVWCVFRTHDDACRALRLNGTRGISVSTALEEDLLPFNKLRRFELQDELESLQSNFSMLPFSSRLLHNLTLISDLPSLASPSPVLYSSDNFRPSPTNPGFITPPTPTTALSSSGSSSEGTSPPSSTLSLLGARSVYGDWPQPTPMSDVSFVMSTNPPSPRNSFKRGDWICPSAPCATHNFGRNPVCIACTAPRPLDMSLTTKPSTDYDRYFDRRAPLLASPPPPRRCANVSPSPTTYRAVQPPRIPSVLTPSGRAFARGGRIRDVSGVPSAPVIMFWPDNEPLPLPCQIRPPFSPGTHPPIMNTGNKGPVEHQPGDWYCGKCSYMNWRRRKVCQTCYPFADGNADGVSPAFQAERINALARIASTALAAIEPRPVKTSTPGLGLNLGAPYPSADALTTSFASLNVNDRRGSVDRGLGRPKPALRLRPSDAALRSTTDVRLRAPDADSVLTFGLPALGTAGARRVSDGNIWATSPVENQGSWPSYLSA